MFFASNKGKEMQLTNFKHELNITLYNVIYMAFPLSHA